ncbi:MAG: hypothetical protein ABJO01_05500 [Parasphingorhabdus sp.]|uniref:hypothetical protein n=1 Tax=Parasphingorhabdus sp. TaxID=2709688 RepID=UPI0032984287
MKKKYLVLALLLTGYASPGMTQHQLVLEKLNQWNNAAPVLSNEELQEAVHSTAKQIYPASKACAESAVTLDRVHPATANRFVFRAVLRQQMRNAWTVTARLPGCDTVPVRYMVMQNNDNSLKTIRVNRGKSYAHDSLISDTLPLALLAATGALQRKGIGCDAKDKFKLGVTRIKSETDGLGPDIFGVRYAGHWAEIWPIEICDQTVEILVKFKADGDGGAFTDLPGDQISILPK